MGWVKENLSEISDHQEVRAMPRLARFEATPLQKIYLDTVMNQVSRSFALVVPCLEEPLNHYMATAYVMCRVIDNIEDCEQSSGWKARRFAEVSVLLNEPLQAAKILSRWQAEAWPGLNADEKKLMSVDGGLTLWQIYADFPEKVRDIVRHWTAAMANGMSHIETPEQAPNLLRVQGVRVLATERDYDQYCYIVAGTVGHLATELVIDHYGLTYHVAETLLANCEACGRALQKTNIVKDFVKDLGRDFCYLPEAWLRQVDYLPLSLNGANPGWSRMVISNVMDELDVATEYLLALPNSAAGYRLASLLCLLPAYQTILLVARNQEQLFTANHKFKISRETMLECVQQANLMVLDNQAILEYSRQMRHSVDAALSLPVTLTEL
jgi:farnesyl-diphosphate farnesyltransferase